MCFALISLSALKSIALPIVGLGVVIFVHELGHFLVAKACGVKCEKFYVGFDVPISLGPIRLPAALFRKQWGETEYGIGIIPLGGYVKMLGQDDNPANAAKEAERVRLKRDEANGSLTSEPDEILDPRSYPAKSVPQRMAIISAGVIMNLIFAVIFATIAYTIGVKYIPCKIGKAIPGEPAWVAGIQPGDQILQLEREGEPDEQLRFIKDLRPKVAFAGSGTELEMLIRHESGDEQWIKVTPSQSMADRMGGLPSIGILAAASNKFGEMTEATAKRLPGFEDHDQVTAVIINGQETAVDEGWKIERLLAQHPRDEMALRVERVTEDGEPTEAVVSLPTRKFRDIGVLMEVQPIGAVLPGSPADRAGLTVDDTILEILGEPLENPLFLDQSLIPLAGEEVACRVRRKNGSEIKLQVIPELPDALRTPGSFTTGAVGSDCLGVAFPPSSKIARVVDGSPAALAGLQPGDVVTGIAFEKTADEVDGEADATDPVANTREEPIEFDRDFDFEEDQMTWPLAVQIIQTKPPGSQIKLQYIRQGELKEINVAAVALDDVYNPDRGLPLIGIEKLRTAGSLGEAFRLGIRETQEGVSQVLQFLRKIGRLYKSIGGPIMIFAQAKQETSQGVANLLTFLTMLSANLAVLNILPIPVLDGGHLMFLAYEGITGRPANEHIVMTLTMLGLSFLLGLMVWVFGMDIYRVFLA